MRSVAYSPNPAPRSTWYGKGLARAALLLALAALIAGVAAAFGIARDYGYLHASILSGSPGGYGPKDSGTAYLMRQLFDDADLRQLEVNFSYHELSEQAELVAQGKLDLAAFVMEEDATFCMQS